ncbi:phage tail terminator-like protein [Tateyamaria sp.]|uniref:phage tail terminator-like protein n=1 Tax=Tateyamaria sp. TaxID=1929288 RepID=UPI003B216DA9
MSNREDKLHAALMARAETITGYPVLWPQKGGNVPSAEHITVQHLPNDNDRRFLGGFDPLISKGFLIITLVSPLNTYEAVTKRKADEIAAAFPINDDLTHGGVTATVLNVSVRAGREEGQRWETPIWIEYNCCSS